MQDRYQMPNEDESPLNDFKLIFYNNKLHLVKGESLPENAALYIQEYLNHCNRYRRLRPESNEIQFSLYQPALTSNAGKRNLYGRLLRKFSRCRFPAAATVGVTAACQCKCVHCSADYHMNSSESDLSNVQLQQIMRESIELGVSNMILLGGEPLLNRELESIIEAVDTEQAQCVLFTNGEHLTTERCHSLKRSGLSGIFASLDSYDAGEHDAFRGRKGIFDKLCDGVIKAKEAGLLIAISTYLTTDRVEQNYFEKMMELGKELGVHEVTFFDAISVGRMNSSESSYLNSASRKKIIELTSVYRKKNDYPLLSPQTILTSEYGNSFCFAANTQFYISSAGQMCPCDFTPLTVGKYPDESVKSLWKKLVTSPFYKRRSKVCRMQDPEFRKVTIDCIPENSVLPYPIEKLEAKKNPLPSGSRRNQHVKSKLV